MLGVLFLPCSQTWGQGGCWDSGQEVEGHLKGTGKLLEFCAKSNQESQSPPKPFTSSEMRLSLAVTCAATAAQLGV